MGFNLRFDCDSVSLFGKTGMITIPISQSAVWIKWGTTCKTPQKSAQHVAHAFYSEPGNEVLIEEQKAFTPSAFTQAREPD